MRVEFPRLCRKTPRVGGREAAARLANQWVDCCFKGACKKDSALVLPDEAVAAKPAADNEGQPPLV